MYGLAGLRICVAGLQKKFPSFAPVRSTFCSDNFNFARFFVETLAMIHCFPVIVDSLSIPRTAKKNFGVSVIAKQEMPFAEIAT